MFPARTQNLPTALKPQYEGWPVLSATSFEEFSAAVAECADGEVIAARFSPPLHTAYLADKATCTLVRIVRAEPMRIALRRAVAANPKISLRKTAVRA